MATIQDQVSLGAYLWLDAAIPNFMNKCLFKMKKNDTSSYIIKKNTAAMCFLNCSLLHLRNQNNPTHYFWKTANLLSNLLCVCPDRPQYVFFVKISHFKESQNLICQKYCLQHTIWKREKILKALIKGFKHAKNEGNYSSPFWDVLTF